MLITLDPSNRVTLHQFKTTETQCGRTEAHYSCKHHSSHGTRRLMALLSWKHILYIVRMDEREKTSKGHLCRENNKTEENPTYFQPREPNATHFHFRGFQRFFRGDVHKRAARDEKTRGGCEGDEEASRGRGEQTDELKGTAKSQKVTHGHTLVIICTHVSLSCYIFLWSKVVITALAAMVLVSSDSRQNISLLFLFLSIQPLDGGLLLKELKILSSPATNKTSPSIHWRSFNRLRLFVPLRASDRL